MPWPMIHFSIAYRMFDGHPCHEFLLGSVAPDAVQFRKDKFSKAKSHLHDCRGSYPDWSGLIIADDLWVNYKRELSGSDKGVLEAIWNEENQYDFNLIRSVPWRDVVERQVITAALYELSDLYALDEIDHWRRQLFIWLQTPQNEPSIENQYLKDSNVGAFIDETAAGISDWIKTKLGA